MKINILTYVLIEKYFYKNTLHRTTKHILSAHLALPNFYFSKYFLFKKHLKNINLIFFITNLHFQVKK
jgi:hypothetical protein